VKSFNQAVKQMSTDY